MLREYISNISYQIYVIFYTYVLCIHLLIVYSLHVLLVYSYQLICAISRHSLHSRSFQGENIAMRLSPSLLCCHPAAPYTKIIDADKGFPG